MPTKQVRIGNGCGFWGDNLDAPVRLALDGDLDYLTLEYLAELTMSILAKLKRKDPQAGYAHDFVDVIHALTPHLPKLPKLKVVTNAGGLNPRACAEALLSHEPFQKLGKKIAIVQGDDLLPILDDLLAQGELLSNLDTGEPLSKIRDQVVSANAYLGAQPIVDALRLGADFVITGRVADASLTVAPAVHEFGWNWHDWDRLASATVAGHLIECGAQVTGGLFTRWQELASSLAHVGYPIAEMAADGTFEITKPHGSGGLVSSETIAEQLLYEVDDPKQYLTPDVIADFTSVQVKGTHLSRASGQPPTPTYKVSISYRDGYMASGMLVIPGPNSAAKARLCGQLMVERLRTAGVQFDRKHIECLGAGDSLPGILPSSADPPEVVLRVAVHDSARWKVDRFAKEFAPLATSGPPGVSGYASGRPEVREVLAYWPTLLRKNRITPKAEMIECSTRSSP